MSSGVGTRAETSAQRNQTVLTRADLAAAQALPSGLVITEERATP
jgi:hypothetical protein